MKSLHITPIFAAICMLVACERTIDPVVVEESQQPWESRPVRIEVGSGVPYTKVGYDYDGKSYKMFWHKGDRIQFANLSDLVNSNACLTAGSEGELTTFYGTVNSWQGESDVVAVYPHHCGLYSYFGEKNTDTDFLHHLSTPVEIYPYTYTSELDSLTSSSCVRVSLTDWNSSISVVPGNHVTNGVYVAYASGATVVDEENYNIPDLEFHQVTSLLNTTLTGFDKNPNFIVIMAENTGLLNSIYVDPKTGIQTWPDNFTDNDKMEFLNQNALEELVYQIIDPGTPISQVYMPVLPCDMNDDEVMLAVVEGNLNVFGEDVNVYMFTKPGRNFERNKIYSLTLDKSKASFVPAPEMTISPVAHDRNRYSFSVTTPSLDNLNYCCIYYSSTPDESGIFYKDYFYELDEKNTFVEVEGGYRADFVFDPSDPELYYYLQKDPLEKVYVFIEENSFYQMKWLKTDFDIEAPATISGDVFIKAVRELAGAGAGAFDDNDSVKKIEFNVNSDVETENVIGENDNIYLRWTGSTGLLEVFTPASCFTGSDFSYMFYKLHNLESISGLEYFETSRATAMNGMFMHCDSLKSLDLSSFCTMNVINMSELLAYCYNLTSFVTSTSFMVPYSDEPNTGYFRMCDNAFVSVDESYNLNDVYITCTARTKSAMLAYCYNLEGDHVHWTVLDSPDEFNGAGNSDMGSETGSW